MKYDFDRPVDRRNTGCYKHDFAGNYFGTDDLIPMWVADMDFRTPDFIMEAIRQRIRHDVLGYSIKPGTFYRSIIDWYGKRQDWAIEKEWILFSPGVVPALSMAIRALTGEGEKVIIQPPVYHPFFSVIRDNHRKPLYNRLREEKGVWKMDLEDLKSKIDRHTRLLLISHPHNPVGRVWTKDELLALAEICLENNIIILSDEIHSDLVYSPFTHLPFSTLSDETAKRTLTFVAPSKTFNTAGLASSVVVIPDPQLREKYSHEVDALHLGMGNIFGNLALDAAYSKGEDWLNQLMEYLQENRDTLDRFIRSRLPDVSMSPPQATYLAWLDMRNLGLKGRKLRHFMIEKARIGCNDGITFGPGGEGFQRLNFACPRSLLEKALLQLETAIRKFL